MNESGSIRKSIQGPHRGAAAAAGECGGRHKPMSKPFARTEFISGIHRRRRFTAEEKVSLVEQTMKPGKQLRLRGLRQNPETPLCSRGSKDAKIVTE